MCTLLPRTYLFLWTIIENHCISATCRTEEWLILKKSIYQFINIWIYYKNNSYKAGISIINYCNIEYLIKLISRNNINFVLSIDWMYINVLVHVIYKSLQITNLCSWGSASSRETISKRCVEWRGLKFPLSSWGIYSSDRFIVYDLSNATEQHCRAVAVTVHPMGSPKYTVTILSV